MYIDLTHTIINNMPSHPLDIIVQLQSTSTFQEHGVANESLCGSVHMGTHIDAPGHFTHNNQKITDVPISRFIGDAICVDVHNYPIITKEVFTHIPLKKNLIILFYTGWDTQLHKSHYFYNHPIIDYDCAQYMIDANVNMIGVDFPSIDNEPYVIHKLLLSNDILIIENLTNLAQLIGKTFTLIALPMKIDAHGAPARVIAEIR